MIKVVNLEKHYGLRKIFHDVNVEIKDGEVVGLIGGSGSGKSLFLRTLMMLEKPNSGAVIFEGVDISSPGADVNSAHEKIGMVFQDFNLFQHMTVLENVMSGLIHLKNMDPKEAYSKAMQLITDIGLADRAYDYPSTLSGGQQQRVAIARTMAMDPSLVLLDEPTSALDPMMRGEVEAVIRMMQAKGKTMVIASHEMELIRGMCSRVLFFADGGVYEEGTPEEILDNPKRDLTRRFVHALRVLEFNVESKSFDFIGVETNIADFAYRNGVPRRLTSRLEAIMEELFQMVIIQPKEKNRMHVSFEFDYKTESLVGTILFSGPKFDADDPAYFISWPIIKMRASEINVEDYEQDGYTNKAIIKID